MKEQIKREYYSEFRAKKTIYNRAPVKKQLCYFQCCGSGSKGIFINLPVLDPTLDQDSGPELLTFYGKFSSDSEVQESRIQWCRKTCFVVVS